MRTTQRASRLTLCTLLGAGSGTPLPQAPLPRLFRFGILRTGQRKEKFELGARAGGPDFGVLYFPRFWFAALLPESMPHTLVKKLVMPFFFWMEVAIPGFTIVLILSIVDSILVSQQWCSWSWRFKIVLWSLSSRNEPGYFVYLVFLDVQVCVGSLWLTEEKYKLVLSLLVIVGRQLDLLHGVCLNSFF